MTKSKANEQHVLYSILSCLVKVMLTICVITFFPGLPPDMNFESIKLTLNPVSFNGKLNNVEKLFLNQVKGPEDLVVYKDELYTSNHGGYISKISNGKIIPIIKFGQDCNDEDLAEEDVCGRPLGFQFDGKGLLYAVDAYYGIKKANLSSGEVVTLVSKDTLIDGLKPKLPNGIALSKKNSDFYWTDSSTTHELMNGLFTLLGNGNGRLLKYNSAQHKNEVLINNVHFPNGVALSADETFVVVSETGACRLLKYNIKGTNAGKVEVFSYLPGLPDNIAYHNGKFIVSIVALPDNILISLYEFPLVRKFIARSLTLVDMVVEELNKLYPCQLFKKISHWVGHFESVNSFTFSERKQAVVLMIDEKGSIVEVLSTTDSGITSVSSMMPFKGYYYLGSPYNSFLGRVKIVN